MSRLSYSTATFDVAAAATDAVVAAQTGRRIRVHGYQIAAQTAAIVAVFKSGTTALTGNIRAVANAGYTMRPSDVPLFQTSPGEALNLTSTNGVSHGCVVYSVG